MTDFSWIITRMHGETIEDESPGGQAAKRVRLAKEAEQTERINQEATAAWQAASLQNVSVDYDYIGAYARGNATFKAGPDGVIQIPNSYVAKERHNLAGFDLATGLKYRNTINSDRPETQAAIGSLRASYVDQNGEAPIRDVRPLAQLAKDFRREGRGFEDFSRNIPGQWTTDQRRLAWQAAADADNISTVGKMLKVVNDTYGAITAPAKYTQEQTLADPLFAKDAKTIYKLFHGEDFQGGGVEAARWLRDHLRWFDLNVAHQALVMYRVRSADYQAIEAYLRAIEQWDQTAVDWSASNIAQNVGRAVADPTNLIGLGPGKAAIMTGGRMALKAVLKRAAEAGAVAGGIGMASTTMSRGIAMGKPATAGEVATSGAVGAVAGAGIGVALSAGARYGSDLIRSGYRRMAGNRGQGVPSFGDSSVQEMGAAVTAVEGATNGNP